MLHVTGGVDEGVGVDTSLASIPPLHPRRGWARGGRAIQDQGQYVVQFGSVGLQAPQVSYSHVMP